MIRYFCEGWKPQGEKEKRAAPFRHAWGRRCRHTDRISNIKAQTELDLPRQVLTHVSDGVVHARVLEGVNPFKSVSGHAFHF